jgi:hypothetical protein
MIAGGGDYQYAQIGFIHIRGGTTKRFTEYNDGTSQAPGWNRTLFLNIIPGQRYNYAVSYNSSTGTISMILDGSTKKTTPWNANAKWSPGWNGQFMGETWDTSDDVPGTAALKAGFRNLRVKTCPTCSATTPTWAWRGSDRAAYRLSTIDAANFDIWTQR